MDTAPYLPGSLSAKALQASVQAGFASPAEDHAAKRIDVLEHLVKHPPATFQMMVQGAAVPFLEMHASALQPLGPD